MVVRLQAQKNYLMVDVKLNPHDVHGLYKRQGGKYFYCGRKISRSGSDVTRDHLFPKCLGNSLVGNKVYACKKCNSQKSDRLPTPAEIDKYLKIYQGFVYSGMVK